MKHRFGFLLQKPDLMPDQNNANHKKEKSFGPKKICPGDAKKWGESLESLVNNEDGLAAFTTFLKSEFSDENIEFWMACEEYKKTTSQTKLASKAKKIYDLYIAVESEKEVNLDSSTREETRKNIEDPKITCFDEAQKKIFLLMEKDSYRRFLKSKYYQDLIQQTRSITSCGMEKKGKNHIPDFSLFLPQCA
ncbi:RGS4 protein, partial [Atractosteus spatula]|nr:RGS4 protein [Atractosteus spatula]